MCPGAHGYVARASSQPPSATDSFVVTAAWPILTESTVWEGWGTPQEGTIQHGGGPRGEEVGEGERLRRQESRSTFSLGLRGGLLYSMVTYGKVSSSLLS